MPTPALIGLGGRRAWAELAGGIVVLGVLEAAAVHFVGRAVLPGSVAGVVDLVAGVLTLAVVAAFVSPLWGSVRISERRIRIRFGWIAAVEVPLEMVGSVREYRADVRHPVELGLDFDAESGLLSIVRSPSSALVRMELSTPVPARTQGWRRVAARGVLVSVDDARRVIDAIEGSPSR
ncbi:hypothetical protein [Nocardia sp. NPDC004722]